MDPIIKINFVDFWAKFDPNNNYIINVLRKQFNVELSPEPEILFFSYFGKEHLSYQCHKVQVLGENVAPDFRLADFAISFDHLDDPRHLRLPLYVMCFDEKNPLDKFLVPKTNTEIENILQQKTGFCSFVVSSKDTQSRIVFFKMLSKYKRIDSGGGVLNNIGGRVPDKMAFIKKYKFNIAFENAIYPGYITEKIIEAKAADTVPIYCGNPLIAEEMNPKSFINYHEFNSFSALMKKVIEVDNNDELYKQYLREPLFYNHQPNEYFDERRLLNFFQQILTSIPGIKPVSTSLLHKIVRTEPIYSITRKRSRKKVFAYNPG